MVFALCASFAPNLSESKDSLPVDLIEDRMVTANQSAAESVTYVFDAEPEVPYLLQLDQQGLDFVLSLEQSSSQPIVANSPLYRDDREFILFEGDGVTPVRISVTSTEFTGAKGTHSILIQRLDQDESRAERKGWEWMSRGGIENAKRTGAGWADAVHAYEQAALFWHSVGKLREYAQAIYTIAWIEYWRHENFARGMTCAADAEAIYRAADESALAANAKQLEAASIIELQQDFRDVDTSCLEKVVPAISNWEETWTQDTRRWDEVALILFGEAAQVHQKLGNRYDVGKITNNIGLTYFYLSKYEEAREYWARAAKNFKDIDEWEAELDPLNNLEVLNLEQGYLVQSIETLERIVEVMPQDRMITARADYLDNLATSYMFYGSFDDARQTYSQALKLHNAVDDEKGKIRSYIGLGKTYYGLGIADLAAANLNEAVRLIDEYEFDDNKIIEPTMRYLGNVEFLRGNFDLAFDRHSEAQTFALSPNQKARLQALVAADLNALGKAPEALAKAREARYSAQEVNSKLTLGDSLVEIGRSQMMLGDLQAARAAFSDARDVYDELGLRDEQARSISYLAAIARQQEDYERAVTLGAEAVELLETLRSRVADPEIRASYTSIRRSIYEEQIQAKMALHGVSGAATAMRDALSIAERSSGRMMVDLLSESELSQAYLTSTDLTERWRQLNHDLANQRFQRDRLIDELSTDATAQTRLRRLLQDMVDTENELKLTNLEIRRSEPDFQNVTATQTLTAGEIMEMVDPDSVLLRFFLGSEKSFVWVVTDNDINAVELASRGDIESVARQAHEYLKTYQSSSTGERALAESLIRLSDIVLRPAWAYVDKPRILVSADAGLQYIPFALLPKPDDGTHLIESHEVVSVPSMTAVKRQRTIGQHKPEAKTLAIFADPVLEMSDVRLTSLPDHFSMSGDSDQLISYIATRSGRDLRRLAASGAEADSIAALVPADSLYLAKGFEASRENVLAMNLDKYRYVHFATHGQIDARFPSLSSLALSKFDASGKEQDGFLRLYDILDLDLNADLVVLSACDTALGREILGEGLIGLAHGFMYAGARSLVVSLWQVSDKATAVLMTRFYEQMITNGLSPSQALRAAQRSLSRDRRWRDPYFWGAFTLLGDWR